MKKQLIGILLSAALLSACGDNNTDPVKPESTDPTPTMEAAPTEPASEPTVAPAEAVVEENGIFSKYFSSGDVEGNGGYFVRIGRKVYYREIAPEAFPQYATFGEYLDYELPLPDSTLSVYDLDSCQEKQLFAVNGNGVLYAGKQGLFLGDTDKELTRLIDPESGYVTTYADGCPIAVSEDGELLATCFWGGHEYSYNVFKDGNPIYHIEDGNEIGEMLGFAGDALIGKCYDDDANYYLVSYDTTGSRTILGNIPAAENTTDPYSIPELIQFLPDKNGCFVSFGYYEGSGHFLSEWVVLAVTPGSADSLKVLKASGVNEYPPYMFSEGGEEPGIYENFNKRIELSDVTYGDLIWHDSPTGVTLLEKDFIYDHYYESEYDPIFWQDDILDAVILDKTAFIIRASGEHIAEKDIGWRAAFMPRSYEYYVIPFGEEMRDDKGNPDQARDLYLNFVEPLPIDMAELTGRWEEYAYIVEGSYGIPMDWEQQTLEFHDDGTVTLTKTDTELNKKVEYTLEEAVDEYGHRPCYKLTNGDLTLTYTMYRLIDERLDVSVEWDNMDGTPGGSDLIFHKAE